MPFSFNLRCLCVRPSVAVLFAALAGFLLASCGGAQAQILRAHQYDQDQGLDNLGLSCLFQDRHGFLLACTENGVFRFDGERFERWGEDKGLPAGGMVLDIRSGSDGRLFVVYADGVFVSAGAADALATTTRFTRVQSTPEYSLDIDSLRASTTEGSDLLIVAHRTLLRIHPRQAGPPLLHPAFTDAMLAAAPVLRQVRTVSRTGGALWLGCGEGELCRVDGNNVSVLGAADGLPEADWEAILVDRSGGLWARSGDQLAHRPRGAARFEIIAVPGGVGRYAGHTDRLALVEDPHGAILTQGPSGLLAFDAGIWQALSMQAGDPEGSIVSIMFDRAGSLWLPVRDQGLFQVLGYGHWESWTRQTGLADDVVWAMAQAPDGTVWLASDNGVEPLNSHAPAQKLPDATFALSVTPAGRIWRATMDGRLERYDPATHRIDGQARLPPAYIMTRDLRGTLWIATKAGVYWQDGVDSPSPPPPQLLPGASDSIRGIALDLQQRLWVTTRRGLYVLAKDGTLHLAMPLGDNNTVRELAAAQDGSLWIATTASGVLRAVVSGDTARPAAPIRMPMLGSNNVLILKRDSRGWMWVGTDRGLDMFDGTRWRHLDEEDGLLSNDMDEDSVLEDADGSMWFGTGHGIAHLRHPRDIVASHPICPVIATALLGDHRISSGPIDWSPLPFVVRFSVLDYSSRQSLRFRYRLKGVDQDWVDTSAREARYPELPAGRRVFSVIAYDPLHHEESAAVSLLLQVRPPWWRSWPFIGAMACTAAALFWTLWRLRIRYLVARQRQLEELVAVRTQEIERARAALYERATRDALTGLPNRTTILGALRTAVQSFEDARRSGDGEPATFCVALVDLDHFKTINDRHGHLAGDAVLHEIGQRLSEALASGEAAGRYGGEELLLLVEGCSSRACEPLQRLSDAMTAQPVVACGASIALTCSIGAAWMRPGDSANDLLRRADEALYAAKHAGRDRIMPEPASEARSRTLAGGPA